MVGHRAADGPDKPFFVRHLQKCVALIILHICLMHGSSCSEICPSHTRLTVGWWNLSSWVPVQGKQAICLEALLGNLSWRWRCQSHPTSKIVKILIQKPAFIMDRDLDLWPLKQPCILYTRLLTKYITYNEQSLCVCSFSGVIEFPRN